MVNLRHSFLQPAGVTVTTEYVLKQFAMHGYRESTKPPEVLADLRLAVCWLFAGKILLKI
jgi:hypothetical protein